MPVDIHFAGTIITDAQLQAFEQERQITLPSDYRTFLLQFNGGVPAPNVFQFAWGDKVAYAHTGRFLGLSYPAALYSFEWNTRVQERISPNFLIIAKDYSDSLFHLVCLVVRGEEVGQVYYMPQYDGKGDSSDEELKKFETDYPSAYYVAESFATFIGRLTEPPPGLFK